MGRKEFKPKDISK